MGIEGTQGLYAKGYNYGTYGYYMDFNGGDYKDFTDKVNHLKSKDWIDIYTRAVAVKWTILNQLDGKFYSTTMMCETPGLDIRNCRYNIEVITFLERDFKAAIGDDGVFEVNSGIT